MNILVIGATGATGQQLLPRLLAAGHTVTALARTPASVTTSHPNLKVVKGDVRDAAALDGAVAGQDAVMNAFGPRSLKPDDIQEVMMRNLIAAMNAHGVKRLVNLSAMGVEPQHKLALMGKLFSTLMLRNVLADKRRGETLLKAANLDYITICPGRLLDTSPRGGVKASLDGAGLEASMTRADLADFMIQQLSENNWLRTSPVIGY